MSCLVRTSSENEHQSSECSGTEQRGATLVEVAITIAFFLLVVVGILQIALHGHTMLMMQHVLIEAARDGSLTTANASSQRVSDIVSGVGGLSSFGMDTSNLNIKVCPLLDPDCTSNNPAGSNQFLLVTISQPIDILWGSGSLTLRAQAVVKNEPI